VLIATFDIASQHMALRVNELLHRHKPRVNAVAVVMEAPKYGVLADTYRETLKLDYPVVLADHASLEGSGPFGAIFHIPTLIVLDREVREVARFNGPVANEHIEQALSKAVRP
jgi:hypothetical protein